MKNRLGEKEQLANAGIHIDEERSVYENRFGVLFDDAVTFPSGTRGTYLRFVWKSPYYVAVLPVLPDGRVVLVRAFRHALRDWCIEVPKGFGRENALPVEVAREELDEETGFDCEQFESCGTIVTDPAFVATPCHMFRAQLTGNRRAPRHETTEAIADLLICSPDEINDIRSTGGIQDAITLLLLEMHGRLG